MFNLKFLILNIFNLSFSNYFRVQSMRYINDGRPRGIFHRLPTSLNYSTRLSVCKSKMIVKVATGEFPWIYPRFNDFYNISHLWCSWNVCTLIKCWKPTFSLSENKTQLLVSFFHFWQLRLNKWKLTNTPLLTLENVNKYTTIDIGKWKPLKGRHFSKAPVSALAFTIM